MRVKLVAGDIGAVEPGWTTLFESDPQATPFLSLEWISAWCRHWSAGGSPWVLAAYDDGRLAGLAPFLLQRRGGLRLLRGLGVGVGNYWDVLAEPKDREQVVAAIADALRRRSSEWDAFFLDKLPEESVTEAALRRAELRLKHVTRTSSPRIVLPLTFDDYLAVLSSRRRTGLRRSLRPLDSGELTMRMRSDPSELRAAVERWQAFKAAWWDKRERAMNPEHGSRRFLDFTVEALTAMVPRGLAAVWEMCEDEEVIAVNICLLDEVALYGWLSGFDHRFEKLRPGHTVVAYGIRWSIETGRRYFDFMLGAEAYKYHYNPVDRAVLTATVGNHRLRSRVTLGVWRLKQAVLSGWVQIPVFGRRRS